MIGLELIIHILSMHCETNYLCHCLTLALKAPQENEIRGGNKHIYYFVRP